MCSRHIRVEFMLMTMYLAMFHSVNSFKDTSTLCKDAMEKEWIKNVRHCLDHTDKIDCLKKLVEDQEKVFMKRKLRKDVMCDGQVSSGMDIRKVLSHINKYKEDVSRRVAAEINQFLEQNEVSIGVGSKLTIKFLPSGNETVDMTVKFNNDSAVSERKMKMNTSNILALLFAPAMFIAGIMPWVLPGVKMAVMFVTMINNMAFSSALFALIRGYIFDTRPDDHIIYINNGYKNHHQPVHQQHHKIYHVPPVR